MQNKGRFLSSTSAVFEWQNELAYYASREYNIYLNGVVVFKGNTNVFSLFELAPNTEYTLTSDMLDGELTFRTKSESVAVSVRDFSAVGEV